MRDLDAFIIEGHQKVIGHYKRLLPGAASETERCALEQRLAAARQALDRYLASHAAVPRAA
jgi:hypothetical protein